MHDPQPIDSLPAAPGPDTHPNRLVADLANGVSNDAWAAFWQQQDAEPDTGTPLVPSVYDAEAALEALEPDVLALMEKMRDAGVVFSLVVLARLTTDPQPDGLHVQQFFTGGGASIPPVRALGALAMAHGIATGAEGTSFTSVPVDSNAGAIVQGLVAGNGLGN